MDINHFLNQRQPRWRQLTTLLDRIDLKGISNLSPTEADELFALYRLVSSDLNLVQTRTGNPAILEYLEGLVGRAYASLSVPRRVRPFKSWWQILRHRFPAVIRAEKSILILAAVVMLAGAAFGFGLTMLDQRSAEVFLTPFPAHIAESPADRVARLEAAERGGESQINDAGSHAVFTTFLFTHNIRVTVFCFALGFTFGIGTVILLFYNGAILGSLAAAYFNDGVMTFFIAWVGPHGSIELPCVIFGSTAGLMIARAQFRRDTGTVRQQLRMMRSSLVTILIGTASFLVLAGFIEGGFSQINEPTIPYLLKIAVAVFLFAGLVAYLFLMPVKSSDAP